MSKLADMNRMAEELLEVLKDLKKIDQWVKKCLSINEQEVLMDPLLELYQKAMGRASQKIDWREAIRVVTPEVRGYSLVGLMERFEVEWAICRAALEALDHDIDSNNLMRDETAIFERFWGRNSSSLAEWFIESFPDKARKIEAEVLETQAQRRLEKSANSPPGVAVSTSTDRDHDAPAKPVSTN
jgi:hypothetical protein